MTHDNVDPVDGPADGPRMIFGRPNANWRPTRSRDEPGSGAMARRTSMHHATSEFNSAHDIGIDLEGVDKNTLVKDLTDLLADARERQVQGEMDAIDASIRLLDDPGDTPMDDFMDREIELSMADVDHAESAIGYESVKSAYRRRRDRPLTLRGVDLHRMIRDRLDFPEPRDDPAWRPAMEDTLNYIDRIHEVLGDDWDEYSEHELIEHIHAEINGADTSASFLDKDDHQHKVLIGRRDGFTTVIEMIKDNPYQVPVQQENPVAPVTKKKGFLSRLFGR